MKVAEAWFMGGNQRWKSCGHPLCFGASRSRSDRHRLWQRRSAYEARQAKLGRQLINYAYAESEDNVNED